jgi:hypothetical protein
MPPVMERPSVIEPVEIAPCGFGGAEGFRVRRHLGVVGVLRAGPEEPAQPVALGPRYDVHVGVGDRLADHVVHRDEGPLGAQGLGHHRRQSLGRREHGAEQRGRQVGQRHVVLTRDDQGVPLEHRTVVEEADHFVVLEHERSRDLTGDDPTEQARVSHPVTIRDHDGPAARSAHRVFSSLRDLLVLRGRNRTGA